MSTFPGGKNDSLVLGAHGQDQGDTNYMLVGNLQVMTRAEHPEGRDS